MYPKGRAPSEAPLGGLRGSALAAGPGQRSRGARPCSASWPLRAPGDFRPGPEPTEGEAAVEARARQRQENAGVGQEFPRLHWKQMPS